MPAQALTATQSVLAALYLFAGVYKGVMPSPVDLTLLTGGLLCMSLLPDWRLGLAAARHPALWLFAALVAFLAASGWPLPRFGLSKLAESIALGLPAMAAAFVLATKDQLRSFGLFCIAVSVPISIVVTGYSLANETLHYSVNFMSGGYQLTGVVLGVGLLAVAAVPMRWPVARVIIAQIILLGLLSTGSTISTVGAAAIAIAVFLWTTPKPRYIPALGIAVLVAIPSLAVSLVVNEPPSLRRIQLKAATAQAQLQADVAPGSQQRVIIDIEGSDTDVTDRIFLFRSAFAQWLEHPVAGAGFGNVEYAPGYRTPHNVALELLAEGGIIAFVLGGLFVASAGLPALLHRSPESALILSLFLFTMAQAMVGGYFIGRIQMFAIGAAMWAPIAVMTMRRAAGRLAPTTSR